MEGLSEESRESNNKVAYLSHRWTGGLASGPSDPVDFVAYCADCGIEDLGDPDEFQSVEYQVCI